MEFKATINDDQAVDERTVTGIAALTGNIDLGRDRIVSGAFKKTVREQKGHIRHLWMHDAWSPPIATIEELKEVKTAELPESITGKHPEVTGGLRVVRKYLETPRGEEVLANIKAGSLNEMSIGFSPVKWEYVEEDADEGGMKFYIRELKEIRLYDVSDVNWGLNPFTEGNVKSLSVVAFKSTGLLHEDKPLDAPALSAFTPLAWDELAPEEKARIAGHYSYKATDEFEKLSLLHHHPDHSPDEQGIGPAVWGSVKASMNALMNGEGDIPEADLYPVYHHLKKHFDEFGKEAPSFAVVSLLRLSASVKFVPAALVINQALTDRQAEKANSLLAELRDVLTAEPPMLSPKALTDALLTRLSIIERSPYITR
jgi:HK97 family phage prohead protease